MTNSGQAASGPTPATLDPTTFAVLFHAIESCVQEMSLSLEYSAWSSIISQVRDFSCGIYDAANPPNALAMFDGLPIHVNAQPVSVAGIVTHFGAEEIEEGDVFMMNSIYHGTSHIGDLVVAMPIFFEGKHYFWAVATGHQMDVGSSLNTSVPVQATDIWKEGFQMPPVKLQSRGKTRKDVLELYLANMRYREFVLGDLMSMVGSCKTGNRRMLELVERNGIDTLVTLGQQLMDYADERTSAVIGAMPDGTYSDVAWVDSDGTGMTHMQVKCTLTISGTEITIDFTGSDPQARGGTNSSWANCQNAASLPVLCCLPTDLTHNSGCLKHIHVIAPKGTIVNAEWPAATADATIVPADAISDAVWKCLAQAIPDEAMAGSARIAPEAVHTGMDRRDPDDPVPFSVIFLNAGSGGGACREYDGWPMMYSTGTVGALKFCSNELLEMQYPLVIRQQEIRPDSMGQGFTRGGPGIQFHWEPLPGAVVDVYPYGDGFFNPPHGLLGGTPADGGAIYRINADGSRLVTGPIGYLRVVEGESLVATSSGGGGYGNPLERPTDMVARDLKDGYISRKTAEDIYGLVFGADGVTVDEEQTAARRAKLADEREIEFIVPTEPDAGTHYKEVQRPGDTFELCPAPPPDADYTL